MPQFDTTLSDVIKDGILHELDHQPFVPSLWTEEISSVLILQPSEVDAECAEIKLVFLNCRCGSIQMVIEPGHFLLDNGLRLFQEMAHQCPHH